MSQPSYCVNHRELMCSVRWGLTEDAASAVLAELGEDAHEITEQRFLDWATFGEGAGE
jgi:hypothetical protein